MPIVGLGTLLEAAREGRFGLLAGNVILIEHAEALTDAAVAAKAPVVLQVSENAVRYHGGRLAPIGLACRALAEAASVPVGLHLDHATTLELCRAAAEIGFGSVMFDASHLPDEENLARTAEAVAWGHAQGIAVEAEIGIVGGKDGRHAPSRPTEPDEARRFVAATGVDALAVQVGSSHAMTTATGHLDLERIALLRDAVDVPLVLHGSSGIPDAELAAGIRAGLVKVNVGTRFNVAFTMAVRTGLVERPETVDPRRYLTPARSAMAAVAADLFTALGAAGRG
jgi:fructose-bisphosphate aldolase class II